MRLWKWKILGYWAYNVVLNHLLPASLNVSPRNTLTHQPPISFIFSRNKTCRSNIKKLLHNCPTFTGNLKYPLKNPTESSIKYPLKGEAKMKLPRKGNWSFVVRFYRLCRLLSNSYSHSVAQTDNRRKKNIVNHIHNTLSNTESRSRRKRLIRLLIIFSKLITLKSTVCSFSSSYIWLIAGVNKKISKSRPLKLILYIIKAFTLELILSCLPFTFTPFCLLIPLLLNLPHWI